MLWLVENLFFKKKSFTRFTLQSECCNFNQWEHSCHVIYNPAYMYLQIPNENHPNSSPHISDGHAWVQIPIQIDEKHWQDWTVIKNGGDCRYITFISYIQFILPNFLFSWNIVKVHLNHVLWSLKCQTQTFKVNLWLNNPLNHSFEGHFFKNYFLITTTLKTHYFLRPYNGFSWVCWFLAQNLTNFVPQ